MSSESPTLSPPETPRRRAGVTDRILALVGSYHIAVVVFLLMILLTLLGTFSQKTLGLYESLNIYFTSWVVPAEHWIFGFIPLPGMALLLAIMFVNLLAGGVIRIRKNWRTIGNVIAHLSMLGLIAAGAVSLWYKQEGHMRIFEAKTGAITAIEPGSSTVIMAPAHGLQKGEFVAIEGVSGGTFVPAINSIFKVSAVTRNTFTVDSECTEVPSSLAGARFENCSNRVQAFQDWVLEVREAGGSDKNAYIVHETEFRTSSPTATTTFHRTGWPFELKISGYQRNATVTPVGDPSVLPGTRNVDGYTLRPLPVNPQHEANMAGVFLDVVDLSGKPIGATVLAQAVSGGEVVDLSDRPFSFSAGGRNFTVNLVRETWEVPFSIHLDDFIASYYPGTRKAKEYESHVTMTNAAGQESKFRIWMNNPLRDSGYVAYQTSFDSESPPGQERYSVLTVVKNPSDQWPLYSMIAATIGLLITFLTKLARFIRRTAGTTPVPAA